MMNNEERFAQAYRIQKGISQRLFEENEELKAENKRLKEMFDCKISDTEYTYDEIGGLNNLM